MERDSCVTVSSWGEEVVAKVVLVGLCRGRGTSCDFGSNLSAALSSGACRLVLLVIFLSLELPFFTLAGVGLLGFLGVCFVLRVHEGLAAWKG